MTKVVFWKTKNFIRRMDCAPLNLAHFHERRAEKLIKRHHYDEAYKAVETSLVYVEDAYKNVRIPKALEVLKTQKWDYERKLNQIQMRKLQYEKIKSKEIVPPVQIENTPNNIKTDIANPQSIARSIDKTIKEFNDKYGSTLLENVHRLELQPKENQDPNRSLKLAKIADEISKEKQTEDVEVHSRLNFLDNHDCTNDDDLPSLVPLELPSFDYTVFGMTSGIEENFQKEM